MYEFHQNKQLHFMQVTLMVLNLTRSLSFYVDILGFKIIERTNHRVLLGTSETEPLIELIEDPLAKPLDITLGLYHYALLLEKRSDLASVIRQLISKHYPITGASDHGVSEAVYLDDPDGHGIEIYVDYPKENWPLEDHKITMYTRPLDTESLMKTDLNLSYQIPKMILGHLHFHVADLKQAKQFYCDILGFQVVMYYGHQAMFVSDKGYHHHLGLNTWQGKAPLTEQRQIGLKAYQLFVPKTEHLKLLKRLQEANITLHEDDGLWITDILNQKIILMFE